MVEINDYVDGYLTVEQVNNIIDDDNYNFNEEQIESYIGECILGFAPVVVNDNGDKAYSAELWDIAYGFEWNFEDE